MDGSRTNNSVSKNYIVRLARSASCFESRPQRRWSRHCLTVTPSLASGLRPELVGLGRLQPNLTWSSLGMSPEVSKLQVTALLGLHVIYCDVLRSVRGDELVNQHPFSLPLRPASGRLSDQH